MNDFVNDEKECFFFVLSILFCGTEFHRIENSNEYCRSNGGNETSFFFYFKLQTKSDSILNHNERREETKKHVE